MFDHEILGRAPVMNPIPQAVQAEPEYDRADTSWMGPEYLRIRDKVKSGGGTYNVGKKSKHPSTAERMKAIHARRAKVLKMIKAGKSKDEIAAKLGIGGGMVLKDARALGVKVRSVSKFASRKSERAGA